MTRNGSWVPFGSFPIVTKIEPYQSLRKKSHLYNLCVSICQIAYFIDQITQALGFLKRIDTQK